MCAVAAELRLFLLHAAAELRCVLYDVPHYENKLPRKSYNQIILYCMYMVRKVLIMLIFRENPYFTLVVTYFGIVQDSIDAFSSNLTQIGTYS